MNCRSGWRSRAAMWILLALAHALSPFGAVAAAASVDATTLFDWAEWKYPELFPKGPSNFSVSYLGVDYTVRAYGNGNYLGVTISGDIFGLGAFTGNALQGFGNSADYAAQVRADACKVNAQTCLAGHRFSALGATMAVGRAMHTATVLPDGKVLITGGFSSAIFPAAALNTAELYDPAVNTFTLLGSRMRSARTSHAAALLLNGQVLLTGGQADNNNGDGVNTAELYDPDTRTFSSLAATMKSPRGGHSATLLPSGKVLLAAGYYQEAGTLKSDAELYDPATQTFTSLAARMVIVTESHAATRLPSGQVLISGGSGGGGVRDTAQLFDPVGQTFRPVAAKMSAHRAALDATLLPGELVLVTGGAPLFSPSALVVLGTAEVFDPITLRFASIAAPMVSPRAGHASVLLLNGSVLITGGVNAAAGGGVVLNSAELFKP